MHTVTKSTYDLTSVVLNIFYNSEFNQLLQFVEAYKGFTFEGLNSNGYKLYGKT